MKLKTPIIITSRLLPGLKIGDTFLSIGYLSTETTGRTKYRVFIDHPEFSHVDEELQSGCHGGNLQEGLSSFLSFLSHSAETTEESLFPKNVVEWARQNSDEIGMLSYELESGQYITE